MPDSHSEWIVGRPDRCVASESSILMVNPHHPSPTLGLVLYEKRVYPHANHKLLFNSLYYDTAKPSTSAEEATFMTRRDLGKIALFQAAMAKAQTT
jgi:hypothetical protein